MDPRSEFTTEIGEGERKFRVETKNGMGTKNKRRKKFQLFSSRYLESESPSYYCMSTCPRTDRQRRSFAVVRKQYAPSTPTLPASNTAILRCPAGSNNSLSRTPSVVGCRVDLQHRLYHPTKGPKRNLSIRVRTYLYMIRNTALNQDSGRRKSKDHWGVNINAIKNGFYNISHCICRWNVGTRDIATETNRPRL